MDVVRPKEEEYKPWTILLSSNWGFINKFCSESIAKGGNLGTLYRFGLQNMPKGKYETVP